MITQVADTMKSFQMFPTLCCFDTLSNPPAWAQVPRSLQVWTGGLQTFQSLARVPRELRGQVNIRLIPEVSSQHVHYAIRLSQMKLQFCGLKISESAFHPKENSVV